MRGSKPRPNDRESAAARRAFGEQPIHLRRQPDEAAHLASSAWVLAARRRSAPRAARRLARGIAAGADLDRAVASRAVTAQSRRPAARLAAHAAVDLAEPARRRPRPGARNDMASSRLVLPAPLAPRAPPVRRRHRARCGVAAEIGEVEARDRRHRRFGGCRKCRYRRYPIAIDPIPPADLGPRKRDRHET